MNHKGPPRRAAPLLFRKTVGVFCDVLSDERLHNRCGHWSRSWCGSAATHEVDEFDTVAVLEWSGLQLRAANDDAVVLDHYHARVELEDP